MPTQHANSDNRPPGIADQLVVLTSGAAPQALRVSAARPRKPHVGHFACMRSLVQGLDARKSWEHCRGWKR